MELPRSPEPRGRAPPAAIRCVLPGSAKACRQRLPPCG